MKFTLFPILISCFVLLAPHCARSAENPQLFGVQPKASSPVSSDFGDLLAVSDEETGGFSMWDVMSRRTLWKSDDYFLSFLDDPPLRAVAPKNAVMVAHGAELVDGELRNLQDVEFDLLDARDGHLLKRMDAAPGNDYSGDEELLDYGFTKDNRQYQVATANHLRIYDVEKGSLYSNYRWSHIGEASTLKSAAFFSGKERGEQAVALDSENNLVILDANSGDLIERLPKDPALQVPSDVDCFLSVSSGDSLGVLDFSHDSQGREFKSYVFRLSDGKVLWQAVWPTLSFDGKLAYVPGQTNLSVLDARTGRKLRTLPGPISASWDVSPDGNSFYEARDGKIWKWRAR